MRFTLRRALIADASVLARLHRETVDGSYAGRYEPAVLAAWREGHTREAWETRILGDKIFVVAEQDGDTLGCGGLVGNRTGVYVLPRAQKLGVARAIYSELERLARDRGHKTLELSAPEPAIPFYSSMGFSKVTARPQRFSNGTAIIVVDMEKTIG